MGGMTCKTCRHEAREAIDQALVAGTPHRSIAEQYSLSPSAVFRHQEGHLPATLVAAAEAGERTRGENLLDRVNGLVDAALASMERRILRCYSAQKGGANPCRPSPSWGSLAFIV